MSIQPSPNFNQQRDQSKWCILLDFVDILTTQFSFKSLILYVNQNLEQAYSCKVQIWLEPLFSDLVAGEGRETGTTLIHEPSPLIEQVSRQKRIVSNISTTPDVGGSFGALVIPLMVRGEVFGAVQLDFAGQLGPAPEEFGFITGFVSLLSLAFHYLKNNTHRQFIQQSAGYLATCEEISKSILSNLDRDSL